MLFLIDCINTRLINPTSGNTTHRYYISSEYNATTNFQSDTINCTSPYCHIICNEPDSCNQLQINALQSNTLIVECTEIKSCCNTNVYATTNHNAYINCASIMACNSANIHLVSTSSDVHIGINCTNPSNKSFSNSACGQSYFSIDGYIDNEGNTTNTMSLYCDSTDCFNATFDSSDLHDVGIYCGGKSACKQSMIKAASADKVDLNCDGLWACDSLDIYCPFYDENICKITCSDDWYSCHSLAIYVEDSYIYNYLDLSCPLQKSLAMKDRNDACTDLGVFCVKGYKDNITYNYYDPGWQCSSTYVTKCCPYWSPSGHKLEVCNDDENCVINCDPVYNDCTIAIIDAYNANYLTLNCESEQCSGSKIICPFGGCSIYCNGTNACASMQIFYYGELADNGIIKINCTTKACYNVIIFAEYIDQIDVLCRGNTACQYTKLIANNANQVRIKANGYRASYWSVWNVNNAKYVETIVTGNNTFYINDLFGQNVSSLIISCSSNANEVGCYTGKWYINSYNTILNCYGTGCFELGHIIIGDYVINSANNESLIEMNIESCGQCSSITSCISNFRLNCDNGTDTFYGDNSNSVQIGCSSSDICGCNAVIDNILYSLDVTDSNCYAPLNIKSCNSSIDCIIDCDNNNSCIHMFIDGSSAKHLTLNCWNNHCQTASIHCPNGGCNITCYGTSSCYQSQVFHQGTGNVTVKCKGIQACYQLMINANYAKLIDIKCISFEQASNWQDYVCQLIKINGKYANLVNITSIEKYGISHSDFNLQNAAGVIVHAIGKGAMQFSELRAQLAGFVEISCMADNVAACISNENFIPYNTIINCYGNGCDHVYSYRTDLYFTTNSSGFYMNIYGCNYCWSISECTNNPFEWYCNVGGQRCYSWKSYNYGDECGCDNWRENRIKYEDSTDNNLCYLLPEIVLPTTTKLNNSLTTTTKIIANGAKNTRISIASIIITTQWILYGILFIVVIYFAIKKKNRERDLTPEELYYISDLNFAGKCYCIFCIVLLIGFLFVGLLPLALSPPNEIENSQQTTCRITSVYGIYGYCTIVESDPGASGSQTTTTSIGKAYSYYMKQTNGEPFDNGCDELRYNGECESNGPNYSKGEEVDCLAPYDNNEECEGEIGTKSGSYTLLIAFGVLAFLFYLCILAIIYKAYSTWSNICCYGNCMRPMNNEIARRQPNRMEMQQITPIQEGPIQEGETNIY